MESLKQTVMLNAPASVIFAELIKWQKASWWPKLPMEFIPMSADNQSYLQKVKLPFGPKWHTKISCIDCEKKYIKREFLDGIFEGGFEELSVADESMPAKVIYNFCYKIKNILSRFFFEVIFKKLHAKNINLILNSLKRYLEAK